MLTNIFNSCIKNEVFPDQLKSADIASIFKGPPPDPTSSHFANFSPNFAKIPPNSAVFRQISPFFAKFRCFSPIFRQFSPYFAKFRRISPNFDRRDMAKSDEVGRNLMLKNQISKNFIFLSI